MKVVVSKHGQITIPKILRQKLGIKPGIVLALKVQNASLILVNIEQDDPVNQVYGCLKLYSDTNESVVRLRGKVR